MNPIDELLLYLAGILGLVLIWLLYLIARERINKKKKPARRAVEPCAPRGQVWGERYRELRKVAKLRIVNPPPGENK